MILVLTVLHTGLLEVVEEEDKTQPLVLVKVVDLVVLMLVLEKVLALVNLVEMVQQTLVLVLVVAAVTDLVAAALV